jgi:O-antigen/teichoic acid export membrane protein
MLDQSALVIFFLLFYNLFIAYLMGKQNFKLAAFFNILYSFLFLISSIISINRLSDINTFFTFSFGVMLLIAGVYSSFRLKSIKLLCLDFVKYKSVYINYTLPAFLSTIVLMPIFLVCYNAIVTTKGYQEFGLFNAANQWRNVVLFFPVIVSKFTLSYLSNNINNKINFKRILKINLLINLTVTLCLCVVVYLSSAYLLEVFSIHKLVDKQLLFILVLSTIPITLNEVVGQVIASRENYWYGFILNSLWAISLLVCFYFVFGISSLGLSYSILTSYSFLLILSMAYSYKKILTL